VESIAQLRDALAEARANTVTTVIRIHTDPLVPGPDSESWWDVPVAEFSTRPSTKEALANYETNRRQQRSYLRPTNIAEGGQDHPS
jgi:3D-(3,5/4)-trihydroxycyclohexane-1,2-dione acylhydrolase (decyclizing)